MRVSTPTAERTIPGDGGLPLLGYSLDIAQGRMLADLSRMRVQQLAVCAPLRTTENRQHACPDWPDPEELGRRVVDLLAQSGHEPVVRFDRRRRT